MLPFIKRLKHYLLYKKHLSSHLWSSDQSGQEWKPERMRNRLKKESQIKIDYKLNLNFYRHITIIISRWYLLESVAFRLDKADEDNKVLKDDPHYILDV